MTNLLGTFSSNKFIFEIYAYATATDSTNAIKLSINNIFDYIQGRMQ